MKLKFTTKPGAVTGRLELIVMCNLTPEIMKELLFSLAWYDASSYHNRNAKDILGNAYPDEDFSAALEEFVKCKAMPPSEGCPR